MIAVDVTHDAVGGIARTLRAGAADVRAVAGSRPGGVDAGEVTPLVAASLAAVMGEAATLSEGLGLAAAAVEDCLADLVAADVSARDTFTSGLGPV